MRMLRCGVCLAFALGTPFGIEAQLLQGTLDGKVGSEPDDDYPNALDYSPDSSYFKPIEAYALKNSVTREEEQLRTMFDQFDAGAKGRRQDAANFSDSDLAAGGMIMSWTLVGAPVTPSIRGTEWP